MEKPYIFNHAVALTYGFMFESDQRGSFVFYTSLKKERKITVLKYKMS